MTFGADVRYALRSIRLRPGWAAAAVITLATGIGANATMFALVDRLLVRPPPHITDPRHVARLSLEFTDRGGGRFSMSTTSYPVFQDLRRAARSFATLAAVSSREMVLGGGSEASALRAEQVSGSYFSLLGPHPALGRFSEHRKISRHPANMWRSSVTRCGGASSPPARRPSGGRSLSTVRHTW